MNVYEFLTQSPKEIAKSLKSVGIERYQDIPDSVDELCGKLSLKKDKRVRHTSTITRREATEWYIYFDIDFGFGPTSFEIELYVKGKVSISYARIGGHNTMVQIYNKVCPLFDERPTYHNLEFYIYGTEYTQYVKHRYSNETKPEFDDKKPLSDYITVIMTLANEYHSTIERVDKSCFNGEYEKAYNNYHFNPFRVGEMIVTEDPGFSGCVHAIHNAQTKFGLELTLDNLQGLYRYMWIHVQEHRKFYDDKNGTTKKPYVTFVAELFSANMGSDCTREILLQLLQTSEVEARIDKKKESWDSVHLSANREFYQATQRIQQEIAEKYKIPVNTINHFIYDSTTDRCRPVAVPAELKERF